MNDISGSMRRQLTALVTMLLLFVALPAPAPANESDHTVFLPIVIAPPGVLTAADENSLRAAIQTANTADQLPRIELMADIELTAPLPTLDNPRAGTATLNGNGHTLDGNGYGTVLTVGPDTTTVIERLTITGGGGEAAEWACGGGIFVAGRLTLRQSQVSNNRADRGGGICVMSPGNTASLTLEETIVTANSANHGGGIYVRAEDGASVQLSVVDSTLSRNRALSGDGGAIYVIAWEGSTHTEIVRSTVSGNSAPGTAGLYHSGFEEGWQSEKGAGYASATIRNSTFSGNASLGDGGAISNRSWPGDYGRAGARWRSPSAPQPPGIGFGSVEVFNSTITGNWAYQGSGIFNINEGIFELFGTIVAGNEPGGRDCWEPVGSGGYNLDSDESCGLGQPTDLPGDLADLRPLALNAPGKTATHALGPDSQARDRIPMGELGCDPATDTDQRGVPRPQPAGGSCDSGAYEVEYPLSVQTILLKIMGLP